MCKYISKNREKQILTDIYIRNNKLKKQEKKMVKHLKLFENHADYAAFIETEDFIRPNVSHCVAENDVHYNPVLYYLTPKQIVEYAHSFIASLDEKFLLHRQEHTDMDRG